MDGLIQDCETYHAIRGNVPVSERRKIPKKDVRYETFFWRDGSFKMKIAAFVDGYPVNCEERAKMRSNA